MAKSVLSPANIEKIARRAELHNVADERADRSRRMFRAGIGYTAGALAAGCWVQDGGPMWVVATVGTGLATIMLSREACPAYLYMGAITIASYAMGSVAPCRTGALWTAAFFGVPSVFVLHSGVRSARNARDARARARGVLPD
jgi:hypothetical protein